MPKFHVTAATRAASYPTVRDASKQVTPRNEVTPLPPSALVKCPLGHAENIPIAFVCTPNCTWEPENYVGMQFKLFMDFNHLSIHMSSASHNRQRLTAAAPTLARCRTATDCITLDFSARFAFSKNFDVEAFLRVRLFASIITLGPCVTSKKQSKSGPLESAFSDDSRGDRGKPGAKADLPTS